MKTVQMTLNHDLIMEVDQIAKSLHTNRSAFTRDALREAVSRYKVKQMEDQHRKGYEKYPASEDKFSAWESEQAWGEE